MSRGQPRGAVHSYLRGDGKRFRVGQCWVCGGHYPVTEQDLMFLHNAWLVTHLRDPGWQEGTRCPGSKQAARTGTIVGPGERRGLLSSDDQGGNHGGKERP